MPKGAFAGGPQRAPDPTRGLLGQQVQEGAQGNCPPTPVRHDCLFARCKISLLDHRGYFPTMKVSRIIKFTFQGCLLCTFLKKVVLAVKKQSSSSSSRLQYPLLMLLSTVI